MEFLKIYETEYKKIRLGSKTDGGYVIADGIKYDLLISCGIANDISFEIDFIKKYETKCLAYDGTIEKLPYTNYHIQNDNITFIKKNISKNETEKLTNLLDIIENNKNIFLKMDIETWEYEWLNIIQKKHLENINQFVIEFHFPFTYSADIFERFSYPIDVNNKIDCLKKISETHYLIHLHGNNCCGIINYNGINVPNVFECTYVNKQLCKQITNNKISIPHPLLDAPNIPSHKDIQLSGYPYCE